MDFLLTAKRDRKAALRFLRRAIGQNGAPTKITIDKSGASGSCRGLSLSVIPKMDPGLMLCPTNFIRINSI